MDITSLYKSLSPEDRAIYQQFRTDLRKVYLNAHSAIVGIDKWTTDDDYFIDLIDIKIAVLFDRMGRIEGVKPVIDKDKEKNIERDIIKRDEVVKEKMNIEQSTASDKLKSLGN